MTPHPLHAEQLGTAGWRAARDGLPPQSRDEAYMAGYRACVYAAQDLAREHPGWSADERWNEKYAIQEGRA